MIQHQEELRIQTRGRSAIDIGALVQEVVAASGISTGLCTVFCCHTSASLMIQENADPAVIDDLLAWLGRIAPDGHPSYTHTAEGPDDMAAHLRTALLRSSEGIPVREGRLATGVWQGLYLVEHRAHPHSRSLIVHVLGEPQ